MRAGRGAGACACRGQVDDEDHFDDDGHRMRVGWRWVCLLDENGTVRAVCLDCVQNPKWDWDDPDPSVGYRGSAGHQNCPLNDASLDIEGGRDSVTLTCSCGATETWERSDV